MSQHHLIMFAAGIGVPILAAMNAQLGRTIGSPASAAFVMFLIASATALAVAFVTGPSAIAKIAVAPKHLLFAGVLIAFYLLSVTWIAPIIGLGNAVFLVLIGQLCAAAAIDQFGLFGAQQTSVTAYRALGLAFMATGVFLAQRG